MKRKVRFFTSPLFVERVLTWRGFVNRPHPKVIQLEPGVYFGHPETVERYKAEIAARVLKESLRILGPVLNSARKN